MSGGGEVGLGVSKDLAYTLVAASGKVHGVAVVPQTPFVIEPESGQGADLRARPCDVSPTVAATDGAKMTDRVVRLASRHGVRRLLPIECERLQGFSDGWTDIASSSDAKRYRAIGNAVAVPVIEWIGRRFRDTH